MLRIFNLYHTRFELQGMTGKSLKHHYALIPLFVIMAIGMAFVAAFCGRLAIYSPDTNWTRYIYYRLFLTLLW